MSTTASQYPQQVLAASAPPHESFTDTMKLRWNSIKARGILGSAVDGFKGLFGLLRGLLKRLLGFSVGVLASLTPSRAVAGAQGNGGEKADVKEGADPKAKQDSDKSVANLAQKEGVAGDLGKFDESANPAQKQGVADGLDKFDESAESSAAEEVAGAAAAGAATVALTDEDDKKVDEQIDQMAKALAADPDAEVTLHLTGLPEDVAKVKQVILDQIDALNDTPLLTVAPDDKDGMLREMRVMGEEVARSRYAQDLSAKQAAFVAGNIVNTRPEYKGCSPDYVMTLVRRLQATPEGRQRIQPGTPEARLAAVLDAESRIKEGYEKQLKAVAGAVLSYNDDAEFSEKLKSEFLEGASKVETVLVSGEIASLAEMKAFGDASLHQVGAPRLIPLKDHLEGAIGQVKAIAVPSAMLLTAPAGDSTNNAKVDNIEGESNSLAQNVIAADNGAGQAVTASSEKSMSHTTKTSDTVSKLTTPGGMSAKVLSGFGSRPVLAEVEELGPDDSDTMNE